MEALRQVDGWDVPNASVAVLGLDGEIDRRGDPTHPYWLASVTKPMTALACLVAAEEGVIDLDEPAGPPGSTIRHLLAHASGLPFEPGGPPIARPGTRRIYSNAGFDVLGKVVAEKAEMPFADYLREAVFVPLGMTDTALHGSPAGAVRAPLVDVARFAAELLAPTLVSDETFAEATSVQFPGLAGVLPGVGRYDPLDWGLGLELKDAKERHWSGSRTSPRAFGHFGGSGTFVWVDPEPEVACVCLTDREFDPWALEAWPPFSDAVLDERGDS
ncbi:MAG TPA: serine hydrolase domain-containing protein [Gaiellaceae bacterium]|nr:serine hydrolase domain-containing protein [Gaiellaceae bacterium]